jgi:putative FmdB family regulatory protein
MPTYDYECEACSHSFEHFQEMSARKLRTCPKCGKRKLVRLVGAGAGVIFRGSGFYETDYKRKQSKPSDSSSSSASSDSKSKGEGSSSSSGAGTKAGGDGASSSSQKSSEPSGGSGAKSDASSS